MRRIAIAVAATVSIVVLLFSYHTSTDSGGASARLAQPPVSRKEFSRMDSCGRHLRHTA